MKTVTFDVTDSLYLPFCLAFQETNLALLHFVENALADGDDDQAKNLMRQIIKNLDSIKAQEKKIEPTPQPAKPSIFQLPLDTQEVLDAKNPMPVLPPLEKQKRTRRSRAEMENKNGH
jgi:hypothetical protein